jgi:hypothetical protein
MPKLGGEETIPSLGEKQPSTRNLELRRFNCGSGARIEAPGRGYIFTQRISGRD